MELEKNEMDKVESLKVGDKLFRRPITKITEKCIYINPTSPFGKERYTKKEVMEYFKRKG